MLYFIYCCGIPYEPCSLPNEVLQDIVLFFNEDACNKFIDTSALLWNLLLHKSKFSTTFTVWNHRQWFLQSKQILKNLPIVKIISNTQGLYFQLSGPEYAIAAFKRFTSRKFHERIAVSCNIPRKRVTIFLEPSIHQAPGQLKNSRVCKRIMISSSGEKSDGNPSGGSSNLSVSGGNSDGDSSGGSSDLSLSGGNSNGNPSGGRSVFSLSGGNSDGNPSGGQSDCDSVSEDEIQVSKSSRKRKAHSIKAKKKNVNRWKEFTAAGNPRAPSMEIYLDWIVSAWSRFQLSLLLNCGITICHDESEDGLVHCFKEHGLIPDGEFDLMEARYAMDQVTAAEEADVGEDEENAYISNESLQFESDDYDI
uniref:Uncharacterized protein n=1 Tax=Ditylenchus dipsaci TaxID=166011 RepID=A0A915E756_9BILA